ncbi:hypothetical protein EIN_176340 [Entamoeba invadens IP1]|uniref:hypothetical protein n=1 Tax=Entamoeba invadens IP1 TaxID=370355 RepID=UPI0002C3E3EE|nr:hypothetical protein EIN_176340 [Entamoeba invadens IP1]ELP93817.1 hypothetical protein EIN_176340 [Entamoeba invadens IP1]|eukprot:XP_004260588.1 hypothetical protein EIN_176340 [Entamoeba invadens IP1]
MSELGYTEPHKILAYQEVNFGTAVVRRAVLVRSELQDDTKVTQCPSFTLEKYNKSHIIAYGQCRRDSPLETRPGKTVLSDIFLIKSSTLPGKVWVHKKLLGSEGDKTVQTLLTNKTLFVTHPGMESEVTRPVVKRPQKEVPSLVSFQVKGEKQMKPIPSLKELGAPLTTPSATSFGKAVKSEKSDKVNIEHVKITPTLPTTGKTIKLETLKAMFAIGSESLEPSLLCVKLFAESLFSPLKHFPTSIPQAEMADYTTDILKLIDTTFVKPDSVLLSSLFIFGIELAQVKQVWEQRKMNQEGVKKLIQDMTRQFQTISFVFTPQMKHIVSLIFEKSTKEEPFDIRAEFLNVTESFVWGEKEVSHLHQSSKPTPIARLNVLQK